jgi:hypothetical protein
VVTVRRLCVVVGMRLAMLDLEPPVELEDTEARLSWRLTSARSSASSVAGCAA